MSNEERGIASRGLTRDELTYISNEIRRRQEEEDMEDVEEFVVCVFFLFNLCYFVH
jgi:hypothetical protein